MTIRTMATPAQIAAFRAGMRREPSAAAIAALDAGRAKRKKPKRVLVRDSFVELPDGFSMQLPVYIDAGIAHGQLHGGQMCELKSSHRNIVGSALVAHGRNVDRARIDHFTITRIAPQPMARWDNLRIACKYVLDSTCRWIKEGAAMLDDKGNVRTEHIGDFDDLIAAERGEIWDYDQLVHEIDRRTYGIRIRFRLAPK